MQSQSDIIYKYVGQEGARKVIKNCTLRFARPSEMNDPFDVYIDDLFNMPLKDFLDKRRSILFDQLINNPDLFAKISDLEFSEPRKISGFLKSLPEAKREALRSELAALEIEEIYPDMKAMRDRMEPDRLLIISQFQDSGIFCATKNHNNLLMWAHYAEQHRGVVLGFKPDLEKDSFLRLLEPVTYSDIRPSFFQAAEDWDSNVDEVTKQDIGAAINRRLIFTKSTHWAYEEELRMFVPFEVPNGQPASYIKYYPHELVEVYLGCRMTDDAKNEMIALAKKLNPDVAIYSAVLVAHSYALDFERIAQMRTK